MTNNKCKNILVESASLNITNSVFSKGKSSFIVATSGIVLLKNVSFNDSEANYEDSGQGLKCNCEALVINDSSFTNMMGP